MTGRLDGKIAIITGGTSGIGRRTVEMFVAEGATVIFAGRREAEGAAIAAALGERAVFQAADVAREADVKALVDLAVGRFGRLDCLFNNAGAPGPVCGIADLPADRADAAMAVLFSGVLYGIKHAAAVMCRQRSGSIINTGSIAGIRAGYTSSYIYASAKAAVIHLTRCVAMELGEHGVRVNSLSPGGILTGIFGKALGLAADRAEVTAKAIEEGLAKMQPIPRAGRTEDVAAAAVFLASDESSFINGHDLVVDGGVSGGRMWTPHQAALNQLRTAFGLEADHA